MVEQGMIDGDLREVGYRHGILLLHQRDYHPGR